MFDRSECALFLSYVLNCIILMFLSYRVLKTMFLYTLVYENRDKQNTIHYAPTTIHYWKCTWKEFQLWIILWKYNSRLHVCQHKYVLSQTQTHYRSHLTRGDNINFITIIIPLEGIEKIKTEKNTVKQQNILINHATT